MRFSNTATAVAVVTAAAFTLTACASAAPSTTGSPNPASASAAAQTEPDQVTIALDWLAQAGNAGGIIAAQELGYYEDANIELTIQPGGTEATSVKVVAGGGAQFGQEYGGTILQARYEGIDLVSVAAGYQKSPGVYIFHKGQDIDSIADFNGRTVYTQVASAGWEYLVEQYGLTDVTAVQFAGSYAAFAQDERAVAQAYLTDTLAELEEAGVETDYIENPTNIDYGSSVFTTQELIDEDPDLVRRFVEATAKGWEYYQDHIEEVSEWLQPLASDYSVEELVTSGQSLEGFIWNEDTAEHGWGYQTQERWDEIVALQIAQGFIPDGSVAEGAWTTEFLPGR